MFKLYNIIIYIYAHQQHLEMVCGQLVKCLKEAAESSIPCRGSGRRRKVAGWSEFVKPELVASQWWYKLWLDAGSPSAGVLFQLKKLAHRRCKYAVLPVRRKEEHIKCSRLAEAMINDPNRSFWSEARRFFGKRVSAFAPVVDNVSGPDDIAKRWCDSFKKLYNTADGSASTELLNTLEAGISSADIEHISLSSQTVREAIGKLKRGKSDGGPLVSDHIIEAPDAICDLLARVFTSVPQHGFMPAAFRDATIQPIPKGSKDPSVSSYYRGIALASSLSKVLEWSILLPLKEFFCTSELQFGFKSGFSTTLCTGVMKAVINRYLNRGCKVYACLIDASKAFDLVDHCVLFKKLLERNTPKPLVCLLYRMWLLFYSIPVLCGILPAVHLNHFALLMASIRFLTSAFIMITELYTAESYPRKFYDTFGSLYCELYCSYFSTLKCHRVMFTLWLPRAPNGALKMPGLISHVVPRSTQQPQRLYPVYFAHVLTSVLIYIL